MLNLARTKKKKNHLNFLFFRQAVCSALALVRFLVMQDLDMQIVNSLKLHLKPLVGTFLELDDKMSL